MQDRVYVFFLIISDIAYASGPSGERDPVRGQFPHIHWYIRIYSLHIFNWHFMSRCRTCLGLMCTQFQSCYSSWGRRTKVRASSVETFARAIRFTCCVRFSTIGQWLFRKIHHLVQSSEASSVFCFFLN